MFIFIIDTSMVWKLPISALDASKHAVEAFLAASPCLGASLQLMLLQTGQTDDCLLSSFGDPITLFRENLRNIEYKESLYMPNTTDFSYPISYALSVVNTHRIKNGTDTFGHGRATWLVEPTNIIIFTDGRAEILKCEIRLDGRDDCRFVSSPVRWDHRVSCVLVKAISKGEQQVEAADALRSFRESTGSLSSLCKTTQGEVMLIRDVRDAATVLRSFSPRIGSYRAQLAIGISLKSASPPHLKGELGTGTGTGSIVAARLLPYDGASPEGHTAVRWPIPESYWVDSTVEKLPPRESLPVFTIIRHVPSPSESSPGLADVSGSPDYFLSLAKELRLHLETFELAPAPGAPISVKKSLGANSQEKFHVCVQGSGKPSTADSTASVGSLMLTSQANVTANAINGSSHAVPPFAVLLASSRTPGSCELRILPFNYPIILPLLQKAFEAIKKCQAQQLPPAQILHQPWYSQCQTELYAYLHTVPSYAYPPVLEMLRHMGLKSLIAQRVAGKQMEDKLHRVPFKQIQLMKGIAITETISLQAAARRRWPISLPLPIEIAMASCEPGRRVILPQSVSKVSPGDMLSVYERMRSVVFGGSKGWTASHLGAKGVNHRSDWLLTAIGGSAMCQHSAVEMGNFYDVLARKEALRDPVLLDTYPPDEDTPEGLIKRKTQVNFGNRFKGGEMVDGMSAGGMEIETNTGVRIVGIEDDDEGEALQQKITIDSTNASDFFMDTPFPANDDGEDLNDNLTYSPQTDRDDDSVDAPDTWLNVYDDDDIARLQYERREVRQVVPSHSPVRTLPPLGIPYAVQSGKRKRDLERSSAGGGIAATSKASGTIQEKVDDVRTDVDANGRGSDDSSVSKVLDSSQNQLDTGEDQTASVVSPVIDTSTSVPNSGVAALISAVPENQLPPGWVQRFSETFHKDYWFNLTNGQSVWEKPLS